MHIFSTGAALHLCMIISAIIATIDNSVSACEITAIPSSVINNKYQLNCYLLATVTND